MGGSDPDECLGELGGADVVHRSVGEHPLGSDPALGEVGGGPEHEPGAGRPAFIAKDLDVGVAGAVVDRSVEVVVTRSASPWTFVWALRPRIRHPPPGRILASFFTSTWTSSPGRSRSKRTRCRGWSIQVGEP